MYYKKFKNIETNRLILRKLEERDIPLYYQRLSSCNEVSKYMLWNTHTDINETIEYVTESIKKYDEENYYKFAIALKESNEIIGVIQLLRFKEKDNSCSFAYMIGKDFWNKGYATEALIAVMKFAFIELDVSKIEADHFCENIVSGKVMKKAGMQYVGMQKQKYEKNFIKHDVELYTISREKFLSSFL